MKPHLDRYESMGLDDGNQQINRALQLAYHALQSFRGAVEACGDMQFARNQHCRKPASQTKIFTSVVSHLKKNLKISHRNLYLQNGTNGIKIVFNVPMINDSDIKKQRETDVFFLKFHWDFAWENMTLCVTRGVVVIALMSPAPAVHVDASDPGFMDFTYPAVLRKSKSIPWIRLSRVFVESLWVLFICLCFVHVCAFGHTDIGHVDVGYMEHCGSLNFLTDPSAGCKCLMPVGEFWKFVGSLIGAYVIYVPCPRGSSEVVKRRRNGRCSTLVTIPGPRNGGFRGQQPVSIQIGPSSKPWVRDLGWGKNGVGGGSRGEGWERAIGDHSLHVVVC